MVCGLSDPILSIPWDGLCSQTTEFGLTVFLRLWHGGWVRVRRNESAWGKLSPLSLQFLRAKQLGCYGGGLTGLCALR